MNEPQTVLQGLLEIEPPQMPPDTGNLLSFWPLFMLALIVLIAGYIGIRYYRSRERKARRLFRETAAQFRQQQIDARQMSFLLAATLQYGLGQPGHARSENGERDAGARALRWQQFQHALSKARYAGAQSEIDAQFLLQETEYWLRTGR